MARIAGKYNVKRQEILYSHEESEEELLHVRFGLLGLPRVIMARKVFTGDSRL